MEKAKKLKEVPIRRKNKNYLAFSSFNVVLPAFGHVSVPHKRKDVSSPSQPLLSAAAQRQVREAI